MHRIAIYCLGGGTRPWQRGKKGNAWDWRIQMEAILGLLHLAHNSGNLYCLFLSTFHTEEKNRWKVRLLGERLISPLFEDSLDVIILTILPRLLCEGQRVIHLYPFAQLLCIATHQLLEMDLCFKCKKLHFQVRFDKPTLTPRMLFCLRFQLFCQASSHFWLQQNSISIHCFVEWRRCSWLPQPNCDK